MADQTQAIDSREQQQKPEDSVDIAALTAAVERLLRRELQLAHERARGKRRGG